jgi:potassium/hydrogen antiporter
MASSSFLMLLGGLLVLAFIAEEAFRWLRIPPVLVLMGCGLLLGPVAKILPAEEFIQVAPHFGALAFLLILFEGGLDLDIRAVMNRLAPGALLAVLGFAVALAVGTGVARAGGLPWASSIALGVILAPISGAIILPLAGQLGLRQEVQTLVVLEGALADVLGVLSMGLVVQVLTGGGVVGLVALGSLLAAAFSVLLAIVAGLLWPRLLRTLADRRFIHVLTFGVALALWGAVEMLGASGALVVLVFGLTLANEREILAALHLDPTPVAEVARDVVERLHRFIAQLTFLVRAFFFVFLGVVVQLRTLPPRRLLEAGAVLVLFVVGRWLVLRFLQSRGRFHLERQEHRIVWFLQPRGLVSAVLAIEAAHLVLPGSEGFLSMASLVIIGSNVVMAIGLGGTTASDPGKAPEAPQPSGRHEVRPPEAVALGSK